MVIASLAELERPTYSYCMSVDFGPSYFLTFLIVSICSFFITFSSSIYTHPILSLPRCLETLLVLHGRINPLLAI